MLLIGCAAPEPSVPRGPRDAYPVPNLSTYAHRYGDAPPVLDAAGLQSLASPAQGAVLLHCWASWSRQSREDLVTLAEEDRDLRCDGVQVIACNFDPPTDWSTRVIPILQGAGATYPCVVIRQEDRAEVRRWLGEDWHYQLPARFVVDEAGRVAAHSYDDSPVSQILAVARRTALETRAASRPPQRPAEVFSRLDRDPSRSPPPRHGETRIPVTSVLQNGSIAHLKLVNLQTGESESLPLLGGGASDPMTRIGEYLAARLGTADGVRIAILPFPSAFNRGADAMGRETAETLATSLRKHGFADIIGPAAAEQGIQHAGVSAEAIQNEPSFARGRIPADYLIIGRLDDARRGDAHRTFIATDSTGESPTAD